MVAVITEVAVAQYHGITAGALWQLPAVHDLAVQVDQEYIAVRRLRGEQRVASGAAGMLPLSTTGQTWVKVFATTAKGTTT